jgi:hypothetical protein
MSEKTWMRSGCIAVLSCVAGVAACSSSSGGTGTTGSSTNAANCPTWNDTADALMAYSPDMSQLGESKVFNFVLVDANPSPPDLANMTWTLKILDASGQPVKDATFTSPGAGVPAIKTWMPQHGHPSTAVPVPTNNGDGTYTISNVYLYMAGVWQVTFNVTAGSMSDSGMFTFCMGT